jgi:hypothetical protein
MRKDRQELQINRQLRRRPMLDQIRPHGLVGQRTPEGGGRIVADARVFEASSKPYRSDVQAGGRAA